MGTEQRLLAGSAAAPQQDFRAEVLPAVPPEPRASPSVPPQTAGKLLWFYKSNSSVSIKGNQARPAGVEGALETNLPSGCLCSVAGHRLHAERSTGGKWPGSGASASPRQAELTMLWSPLSPKERREESEGRGDG